MMSAQRETRRPYFDRIVPGGGHARDESPSCTTSSVGDEYSRQKRIRCARLDRLVQWSFLENLPIAASRSRGSGRSRLPRGRPTSSPTIDVFWGAGFSSSIWSVFRSRTPVLLIWPAGASASFTNRYIVLVFVALWARLSFYLAVAAWRERRHALRPHHEGARAVTRRSTPCG